MSYKVFTFTPHESTRRADGGADRGDVDRARGIGEWPIVRHIHHRPSLKWHHPIINLVNYRHT